MGTLLGQIMKRTMLRHKRQKSARREGRVGIPRPENGRPVATSVIFTTYPDKIGLGGTPGLVAASRTRLEVDGVDVESHRCHRHGTGPEPRGGSPSVVRSTASIRSTVPVS